MGYGTGKTKLGGEDEVASRSGEGVSKAGLGGEVLYVSMYEVPFHITSTSQISITKQY